MNDLSTCSDDPAPVLARLLNKRKVTAADVAALRASELGVGVRTAAEAETLFAIDHGAATCREWGEFLIETMLDFLIWDDRPVGRLTESRARWLCAHAGERPTPACMALLIAILDDGADVPTWFPQAVQVRARNVFPRVASTPSHAAA